MIKQDFIRCVILWEDFEGITHELPAAICWDDNYKTWLEPDKERCDPKLFEMYVDEKEIIEEIEKL